MRRACRGLDSRRRSQVEPIARGEADATVATPVGWAYDDDGGIVRGAAALGGGAGGGAGGAGEDVERLLRGGMSWAPRWAIEAYASADADCALGLELVDEVWGEANRREPKSGDEV